MLVKCLSQEYSYEVASHVCAHLGSAKYLGRLACVCRELRDYLLRGDGEEHWLKMVELVGKSVEWREDVARVLCPWQMRKGPMAMKVEMGGVEWRVGRIEQWIFHVNQGMEHLYVKGPLVTSDGQQRAGGGVLLSKQAPYNEIVQTVAQIESFVETRYEWSCGFESVHAMLVAHGFVPDWLETDDDDKADNVRFIPFHTSSMGVVVMGMENPVIHIFHVYNENDEHTIKRFCYVRTFHMPHFMYRTQILCDQRNGLWWIPLHMGTFEVWGASQQKQETRTPASQLYPVYSVLEKNVSVDRDEIFERYAPFLRQHVNVKLPYTNPDNAETLLHTAVRNGDEKYVDILLQMGADPHVPNEEEGLTPLTLAMSMANDALVKRLSCK